MDILPLSNAIELGKKIANELNVNELISKIKKFPDGEIYFRILKKPSEEVVIVQSGYPNPNTALIETFLAIKTLKKYDVKVTLVMPYFPYGRQDKIFKDGEALSLEVVSFLLKKCGVDFLITFDAHFRDTYGEYKLYGIKANNLTASHLLVNIIKNKFKIKDLILISPDFGSRGLVSEASKKCNLKIETLNKERIGSKEVKMKGKLNVNGKDVLILDDIISTGGTMINAIKITKKFNAKRVFAAATHGLFIGNAFEKIRNEVDYLITTDSIMNKSEKVSISKEISKILKI